MSGSRRGRGCVSVWYGAGNRNTGATASAQIPLAEFAPLSAVHGVVFFSLQKGSPAAQIATHRQAS